MIGSGNLQLNEVAHDLLTLPKGVHAVGDNRKPATRARENVVELWLFAALSPRSNSSLQVLCFFPFMTWF